MAQNRKPPAYQEYASAMLASKSFKLMSLVERGLLFTMRLECWENKDVPSDTKYLAKYLGCDYQEINSAMTTNLMSFFTKKDNTLISDELENYRRHLEEIKIKQQQGGKAGAAITNGKNKRLKESAIVNSSNDVQLKSASQESQLTRQDSRVSLVKLNQEQLSQDQSLVSDDKDPWIAEYDRAESNVYESIRG